MKASFHSFVRSFVRLGDETLRLASNVNNGCGRWASTRPPSRCCGRRGSWPPATKPRPSAGTTRDSTRKRCKTPWSSKHRHSPASHGCTRGMESMSVVAVFVVVVFIVAVFVVVVFVGFVVVVVVVAIVSSSSSSPPPSPPSPSSSSLLSVILMFVVACSDRRQHRRHMSTVIVPPNCLTSDGFAACCCVGVLGCWWCWWCWLGPRR